MNLGGDDDFELENRTENSVNCSPCLSSGWPFSGADLANTAMGLVNPANPSSKEDLILPSCSSASMVDCFGPNFNGGYFDDYNNFNSLNLVGISRDSAASLRRSVDTTLDMSWNPPNQMVKRINLSNLIHPSLPQFPADSAFIERAATLSCFNGGNLMKTASHFSIPQPIALYSRSLVIPGNQELTAINGIRSDTMGQPQKHDNSHIGEISMDVCLEDGTNSPKNEEQNENQLSFLDKEKQCIGGLENEMSGSGQDEPSMVEVRCKESSGNKKRKRSRQSNELDQAREAAQQTGESARDDDEIQCNNDQNPCSVNEKSTEKHGSQASGPPKEEYIHVRARRGQATNSHSLAERVRREKISERMKFLQDLVPGCSKVTGKAVMLDEIINYVQSLQRQVEFLSMKLATVNPRMDFSIDGLAKDILKTRPGPSSSLGYSPDISMAYPSPLQLSQQGLLSWGVNGMGDSSEILRRTLASQLTPLTGGFKEPSQPSNLWEEDLQNVFQTSFGTAAPSNNQNVDGSLPPGDMKVEL